MVSHSRKNIWPPSRNSAGLRRNHTMSNSSGSRSKCCLPLMQIVDNITPWYSLLRGRGLTKFEKELFLSNKSYKIWWIESGILIVFILFVCSCFQILRIHEKG